MMHHLRRLESTSLLFFMTGGISFVSAWTSLGTTAALPKVSGHASCETNNGVFLFGGLLSDRTATNDSWEYTDGWTRVETKGDGPGPRMYATASRLGDDIFIVGGWDPEEKGSGGTFKDDVYSINTKTREWTKHDALPCGPVSRHTSCTVGDCIIIQTYKEGDETVIVLNANGKTHAQPTTGPAPVGLSMCSAASLGPNKLVLFGGSTKTQQFSEYVYLLDTKAWEWKRLESRGDELPTAVASTCMAAVDDSTCLVFGGAGLAKDGYEGGAGLRATNKAWLLRIVNDKYADWTLLSNEKSPRPRVAASLSKLPDSKFLLTGGWDPATADTFDEPWTIEV